MAMKTLNPDQVEKRNDRLNRLGLAVSMFPQTPFHSSGLVFCAIGDSKEKDFVTSIGKYGQSWSFDVQLGISTGMAPRTKAQKVRYVCEDVRIALERT